MLHAKGFGEIHEFLKAKYIGVKIEFAEDEGLTPSFSGSSPTFSFLSYKPQAI
jgi:hypothetical protein